MIIVSELRGQLGNRLFLCAYGMALAEATHQRLIQLCLHHYSDHFPAAQRWGPVWYQFASRKLVRIFIQILRHLTWMKECFVYVGWMVDFNYSPTDPGFVAKVKSRWLTIIEGFPEPAKVTFPSTGAIRKTFTPSQTILDAVTRHLSPLRSNANVLIGIHVRHGDYALYYGGRFLYPITFYGDVMDAMEKLFPGRKVGFLVCSDVAQPLESLHRANILPGLGDLLGDLYSLAACDYLIGPPSTFSLWAAFHGRKPILHLFEPRVPSSLNDFMIPDGHFECLDFKLSIEERQLIHRDW